MLHIRPMLLQPGGCTHAACRAHARRLRVQPLGPALTSMPSASSWNCSMEPTSAPIVLASCRMSGIVALRRVTSGPSCLQKVSACPGSAAGRARRGGERSVSSGQRGRTCQRRRCTARAAGAAADCTHLVLLLDNLAALLGVGRHRGSGRRRAPAPAVLRAAAAVMRAPAARRQWAAPGRSRGLAPRSGGSPAPPSRARGLFGPRQHPRAAGRLPLAPPRC